MFGDSHRLTCVAGLPHSGSTLLCQLLGEHPEIFSNGFSSPLASGIEESLNSFGHNTFLLSQLDKNFDQVNAQLSGFVSGAAYHYYFNSKSPILPTEKVIIDKNRHWLGMLEILENIDPNFKVLVCIRNLFDVFASIEGQHQNSPLIRYPNQKGSALQDFRYNFAFHEGGYVKQALNSILNVMTCYPEEKIRKHIKFIFFEDLIAAPIPTMQNIFEVLQVDNFSVNPNDLHVSENNESDSHYHMKHSHRTHDNIYKPRNLNGTGDVVSNHIKNVIKQQFPWFFDRFYPQNRIDEQSKLAIASSFEK